MPLTKQIEIFQDAVANASKKKKGFRTAKNGLTEDQLEEVFNLSKLLIQLASASIDERQTTPRKGQGLNPINVGSPFPTSLELKPDDLEWVAGVQPAPNNPPSSAHPPSYD